MLYSKILVTGCGGDLGIGIGRIIKMAGIANQVIGCDIKEYHAGLKIFDKCYKTDKPTKNGYIDTLMNIVKTEKIDVVIPCVEDEIRFLSEKNLLLDQLFLTANTKALSIGLDKLTTFNFLKAINIQPPWTKKVSDGYPEELPCIIKPRIGSGSRNISLAEEDNVEYLKNKYGDYIWQEYLYPDNEEYTCAVYRCQNKDVRTLIIKRTLQGGFTSSGIIVENHEINKMLIKIAKNLDLQGSINVQMRITESGPKIFEINPRFSSTVVFRHLLGFEDLVWSLKEHREILLPSYIKPKEGTQFYRIPNEVILDT